MNFSLQPQVIYREVSGQPCEPYECLVLSLKMASVAVSSGSVNVAGKCRICKLVAMDAPMEFHCPWSGWFRGEFMRLTRGDGIMNHSFLEPPDQWG